MSYQQQGPYGPQQPPYGPPPGYGYPPQPPQKGKGPLFWIFVVGLPLVLLGSCMGALVVIGSSAPDIVTATAPPAENPRRAEPRPTAEQTQADEIAEQAPTDTQQAAAAVGAAITLHGNDPGLQMEVTVTKVVERATPANDFLKPKTGNRLVAVELQLRNAGQAVYDDSPSNGALLIDDQGQQYRSTYGEVREGVLLSAVTVSPGDSRKGVVLYEIPETVKLAKFQFGLNSGFASQKGEWTLQ